MDARGHCYAGACFERVEARHYEAIGGVAGIIAIAGVTAAVAGSGVSAYAASEQAHQQQQMAAYNAKIAENQMVYTQEQGKLQAETEELRQRRVMATQHAAFAAAGVDTSEGTPLTVAMESASLAKRDLQLLKYGTDIRATGWAAQASQQRSLVGAYGTQRATNAGVSLLGGAAQIGAAYGRPYRYGAQPA